MVYTPEEERKWRKGQVVDVDGKRYRVYSMPYYCGDVEMLLHEIEAIIGRERMAKLFCIPENQYIGFVYSNVHECFLIQKRELIE